MKTIKDLAKALCQTEGLKKQVNIAQMSEIVGVLSDILYKEYIPATHPVASTLYFNGLKRTKKRKAKKGKKK